MDGNLGVILAAPHDKEKHEEKNKGAISFEKRLLACPTFLCLFIH